MRMPSLLCAAALLSGCPGNVINGDIGGDGFTVVESVAFELRGVDQGTSLPFHDITVWMMPVADSCTRFPALVAERGTDGIAVVALAAIGVSTFYAEAASLIWGTILGIVAVLVVLAVKPLAMGLIGLVRLVPPLTGLAGRLEESYLAMRTCLAPVPLMVTVVASLVAWWAECVGYWLVLYGLGIWAGLDAATFLYAFATVFGAPSPGGMGMADAALAEGAVALVDGLTDPQALAASLLIRVATLWFGVILGAVALLRLESVLDLAEAEAASARNVLAAAERAGVGRIVYLGAPRPEGEVSHHIHARLRTGEILRSGAPSCIELRAGMVVGAGSESWLIVRDLALRLPVMVLPRWLKRRSQPVALADVLGALQAALHLDDEGSHVYDLPGPEALSGRQILKRIAASRGIRTVMIPVPVLTPSLSSHWIRLVTRADYTVARQLVDGLTCDLVATGPALWDRCPELPRTSFDEAVDQALSDEGVVQGVGSRVERLARVLSLPA